jgi:5-(aminomethyl)-3-furanmethanol phosphate kinase
MRQPAIRVVKVGGSLWDCPQLGDDLRRWLGRQSDAHHILVAGGGGWADLIRQADVRFGLNQYAAHWLCVRAMRITARLLAELLPEATLVVDFERLHCGHSSSGPTIFDPWSFLRSIEPHRPGPQLPQSWDVTSDSIAGRLAIVLPADELVLLKSTSPGAEVTIDAMTHAGYVDPFFATLAPHLPPLRVVDFRAADFPSWKVVGPAKQ